MQGKHIEAIMIYGKVDKVTAIQCYFEANNNVREAIKLARQQNNNSSVLSESSFVNSDLPTLVTPSDNNNDDLLKAIEESKLAVIPLTQMRRGDSEPVGINNVGNTCFLSSLLQTYYSIPGFVKCIFYFFEKSLRVGSDPASVKIQSGQQVIWQL